MTARINQVDKEIKEFLDEKVIQYNTHNFIESDPISIPHQYSSKEDIEISAFLTSTIAWGKRQMIITNAQKMMSLMGESPHDFVMSHKSNDLKKFYGFVHRTFNSEDLKYFISSLKNIYSTKGGMESIFSKNISNSSIQPAISEFKKVFFSIPHSVRTTKHVSDPLAGSAAKRINMMLRWLVRNDKCGVDFVIWKSISQSVLSGLNKYSVL